MNTMVKRGIRGLYRTDVSNGIRLAAVMYRNSAPFDVPEAYYRFRGYSPEFDELPTKMEYEVKNAAPAAKETP